MTRAEIVEGKTYITDGGLETSLIFHEGYDLPHFAAFDLLRTLKGKQSIADYYRRYLNIAKGYGAGFIFESPTWRASKDWGDLMGYSDVALDAINHEAISMLKALADNEDSKTDCIISGCLGPRGDGYDPSQIMTAAEAEAYHSQQIRSLSAAGVDIISAITMTNIAEAIGITKAAMACSIEAVDAATGGGPIYFMINCAHPTHFIDKIEGIEQWKSRIRGIRANASKCSHAELDEAEELDDGDPLEFGEDYKALKEALPNLQVFGGCCGTDHRHIEALARNVIE